MNGELGPVSVMDQRRARGRTGDYSRGGESGSVSLELVGALPVLAISLLASLQFVVAGYVLWSAGTAARAGARAALTGGGVEGAARHALPGVLAEDSRVTREDGVTVSVRLPALIPGLPETWLEGSSDLGR